jgi:hypothetical protein
MGRVERVAIGDAEADLATAAGRGRRRLDRVAGPQPEHDARIEGEEGESRRGFDRGFAEQSAIEGGARRRAFDVEDDEIGVGHRIVSFI